MPSVVRDSLPTSLYAHTCQRINFAALRGKRIAVLGGGASAFDNAQHALECGAGEVHVFVRRQQLPRINPIRQMEYTGVCGVMCMISRAYGLALPYCRIGYYHRLCGCTSAAKLTAVLDQRFMQHKLANFSAVPGMQNMHCM